MGVSKNSGTPKSSILIGFSIINIYKPSILGTLIFGNTHMVFWPNDENMSRENGLEARLPRTNLKVIFLIIIHVLDT